MAILRYIFILSLLIIGACWQKVSNDYEKSIIGEWTYIDEQPGVATGNFTIVSVWGEAVNGYCFLTDNICEYKLGYFKETNNKETQFLGTTTRYKIDNDVLRILNLTDSSWISTKIVSMTSDTLILKENDGTLLRYSKANYNLDSSEHYDAIIVSSSGCYGPCPINNIIINRTGQVLYFGVRHNTVNGFYKSQINSNEFLKMEEHFKKASIKKLQDHYAANCSDDEEVSVTFIKDNKIVKSISDFGHQSPTEFYWAYTSARYFYQKLQLDNISKSLNYLPFHFTMFEVEGKVCRLTISESFYLWTLLLNSKETEKVFTGKYIIKNSRQEHKRDIATDGRFYKITALDGSIKIYDLGFNFIKTNGLDKKLKPKNKYD
jgi:hypothetical protein